MCNFCDLVLCFIIMAFSSADIESRLVALNFENDAESIVDALFSVVYSSSFDESRVYVAREDIIYDAMCQCLYFYEEGAEIPPSVEKMFRTAISDVKEHCENRQTRRTLQYERMTGLW